MSEKCGKCAVSLVSSDVPIKCIECSSIFHPTCTSVGSAQNVTKLKLRNWKCEVCREESASTTSNKSTDGTKAILDALHTMDTKINSNIAQVKDSIDLLRDQISRLDARCSHMEETQLQLQGRCEKLDKENEELRDALSMVQRRLNDSEQHSRCCNLEVVGLPATKGEDLLWFLEKLAEILGMQFRKDDISMVHRLRLFSRRHTHAPIVVQFTSRLVRETWLAAARTKRGVRTSQIAASLPESTLFLNEQLTPHNKTLLGRARRLQRERKIHFAGFFNGKVLVKVTEGDASIRVHQLQDLDRYEK